MYKITILSNLFSGKNVKKHKKLGYTLEFIAKQWSSISRSYFFCSEDWISGSGVLNKYSVTELHPQPTYFLQSNKVFQSCPRCPVIHSAAQVDLELVTLSSQLSDITKITGLHFLNNSC